MVISGRTSGDATDRSAISRSTVGELLTASFEGELAVCLVRHALPSPLEAFRLRWAVD
jgi:hypothetical protein